MDLVFGFHAADGLEQLAVNRLDGFEHAFAEIAGAAVAQFDGLMGTGRSTRRHRRAAHRAVFENDIDLDGRISTAVQDFTPDNVDDGGHLRCPRLI